MSLLMEQTKDDVCIIPDHFDAYLDGRNHEHDKKLWSVFQLTAQHLESGEEEQKRHFSAIEGKLDEIIRVLNDNNSVYRTISEKLDKLSASILQTSTLQPDHLNSYGKSVKQLQKNISKVKDLRGRFLRAEQMSSYTEEMLAMDPPFVQRKFRVKVSKGTPADEIESYENEAIHRATMETKRLKIRMNRWDKDLAKLNEEIQDALTSSDIKESDRVKFEIQLKKGEDLNRRKSLRAFQRIQRTCEKELNSSDTQFLLKYVEERNWALEGGDNSQKSKDKSRPHYSRHRKEYTP